MLFPSEQFTNFSNMSCPPWVKAGKDIRKMQQYEDPLEVRAQSSPISWASPVCVDAGSMQLYCTFKMFPPGSKAVNADVSSCRTSEIPPELNTVPSGEEAVGSEFACSVQKGVDLPAKSIHSDAWTQE